jgi:endonuclease I
MSDRATLRYSHQESDIHHLQPTVSGANSTRGNFPYGEPVSDRNLNHLPAVLGRDASGRQVFSPRAERRGDVARMMFYFNVRWGIDLPDYEEVVLKAWMAADPVDDRERARNDLVANIQGNRNPFVDCPQFVARIGDFAAFQSIDTDANLPAP